MHRTGGQSADEESLPELQMKRVLARKILLLCLIAAVFVASMYRSQYSQNDVHFSNAAHDGNNAYHVNSNVTIPAALHHAAKNNSGIPKYTAHLAKEAIRPSSSWKCSAKKDGDLSSNYNHTIFAFVHIYKAGGTTLRQFFHAFAYACHKNWISLARCTGIAPSSIKSGGTWNPCRIEEAVDGWHRRKEQYTQPKRPNFVHPKLGPVLNNSLLEMVDIYGGHARIGTGDFITSSNVRYIIFFRDPIERYVSGHLYQNKVHKRHESLDQVVKKIKQKIANARENDNYMVTSSSYLLTPTQRVENEHLDVDKLMDTASPNMTHSSTSFAAAEARAKLIIQNMYRYNAIIGSTERMPESLNMLRHILLNEPDEDLMDEAEKVFEKFGATSQSNSSATTSDLKVGGVQANKSSKRDVSTSAVIAELAKDQQHMVLFEEYVRFERMITDFARTMHNLQYDAAMGNGRIS